MADWYWKRHDTSPPLPVRVRASDGTVPFGTLAGASAKFIMRAQGSNIPKIDATATITDATDWAMEYQPVTGDTDTTGLYDSEFEITYATGRKQTFPDPGYLVVEVVADLDNT